MAAPHPDNLLWHPVLDRGGQAALPGAEPEEKVSIDADQSRRLHDNCADVVWSRQAREVEAGPVGKLSRKKRRAHSSPR
jgi:hypothetical protein